MIGAATACASKTADTRGTPTETADCGIAVDRFKELEIVDEGVVGDARSMNATKGPWSFRNALENMMPEGADPSAFTRAWLDDWVSRTSFNGYTLNRESRADGMRTRIICPWLRRTPSNQCDDACTTCAAEKLDLAVAPFRLLAIANRMDLRVKPDRNATAGEGRLVFGLVDGLGDDPAAAGLPMTIIFEYGLPDSLTTKQWGDTWHALSSHPSLDGSYKADLQAVTDRFTSRNAVPSKRNGSAISQVRVNESTTNWIWQLREFALDVNGALTTSITKDSPAEALNGTPALLGLINANTDAVLQDKLVVPPYMDSGAIDQMLFTWNLPGIETRTAQAFVRTTCNGCHASGLNPAVDVVFHVSPFRKGVEKLSPFVNDPSNPAADDLGRREILVKSLLCGGT